ncbi:MAG TPA: transporter substrate-binding domain-containing protein [Candidatus Binataceae bacterium]|nr:transporter substrate-binding domain-containing protein [Candidatus Binataceae bacterium]
MRTTLALIFLAFVAAPSWAAEVGPQGPEQIRVAVYVDPPFVMRTDGRYVGFAIELWEKIAAANGWKFAYTQVPTLTALIDAIADGHADVGVTDLFITSVRLKRIDYSQPYFDSGLQVMVDSNRQSDLGELIRGLSQAGHLRVFGITFAVIMLATIVLTIVDRKMDPEFPENWIPGLAQSFYHVMSTSTAGSSSHKRLIPGAVGYVISAVFLACGVLLIAYVTSSITSVMTINNIRGQVGGPEDLVGKRVATIVGSTAEAYCRSAGLNAESFADIDTAVRELLSRRVDAIVYDSPTLRYFDRQHPEMPVTEIGPIFEPRKYGFALAKDSPLRIPINQQLLELSEDGYSRSLNRKYFGKGP